MSQNPAPTPPDEPPRSDLTETASRGGTRPTRSTWLMVLAIVATLAGTAAVAWMFASEDARNLPRTATPDDPEAKKKAEEEARAKAAAAEKKRVAEEEQARVRNEIEAMWRQGEAGDCAGLRDKAAAMQKSHPDQVSGFTMMLSALAGLSAPVTAIEAAAQLAHESVGGRWGDPNESATDRFRLAMMTGQLDDALGYMRSWHGTMSQRFPRRRHGYALRHIALVLLEAGEDGKAAAIARQYLDQVGDGDHPHGTNAGMLSLDAVPAMLRVLAATGNLDNVRWQNRVEAWRMRAEQKQVKAADRPYLWVFGYAAAVHGPSEATLAVAELDQPTEFPTYLRQTLAAADIGHAFLEAGNLDRAQHWLRKAVADCFVYYNPLRAQWARFDLGRLHERAGDNEAACAMYQEVVQRWPAPQPRSVTVDKARARVQALGCGSPNDAQPDENAAK